MTDSDLLPHATKQRLLDAAGPVFAGAGYDGASLRTICSLAGANLAAVKYHFGSKLDLYQAVLGEAGTYARDHHPFPADYGGTPAERLGTLIDCIMRRVLDRGRPAWHARLMSREMADPSPSFSLIVDGLAKPLIAQMEAAVAALLPAVGPSEIRAHAFSVVGQCLFYRHAAQLLAHLDADNDPADRVDAIAQHITRFSLTAIAHRAEHP